MDVRDYAIMAFPLARYQLRKLLLEITGDEGLLDLLPRGDTGGSFMSSEIHDYISGVHITFATADTPLFFNES